MKGERQSGQREQWSSAPAGLAGREESCRSTEKSSGIVAVSLEDAQTAAALAGHGLHTVASAAEARI